jgi:probable H4MPT-linked C1 transfer pathway protein
MTGELADCFPAKAAGVRHILTSVCEAAAGLPVSVYLVDGRLVTPELAVAEPMLAAASNWHALARFAGRCVPGGSALLLDAGSTTCDLIPVVEGQPAATGKTDTQRMLAGELVYTGVERSPVCAVVGRVPYRGRSCAVAQELFATMRDVYLVLGDLPEQPDDLQTADGRPATRTAAIARLARMVCADETEFGEPDAVAMAAAAAEAQVELVCAALRSIVRRDGCSARKMGPAPGPGGPVPVAYSGTASLDFPVVLSGHGDFLMRRMLRQFGHWGRIISLSDLLGPAVSRAATAYALAVLLSEANSP